MKRLLAAICLVMLVAGGAFAAIAVEHAPGMLIITLDGTNGFTWATSTVTLGKKVGAKVSDIYPEGIALTSVDFQGPAAAAKGVWRDGTATGPKMGPPFNTIDGGPQTKYFTGYWMRKPCLVHADQTTDTSAVWYFYFDTPMR